MDNPFSGVTTTDAIKGLYRKLALEHHPDRGGDTATMQKVNAWYHDALKGLDGTRFTRHDNGKEYTYRYNFEAEEEVIEHFNAALSLNMEDVEVLIIGSWVWVRGNTKPYREDLGRKGLGFRWHADRKAWYWRKYRKRRATYNPAASLDELQDKYGGETGKARGNANVSHKPARA